MAWSPYKACCAETARDPDYALCGECGHALLRCMAFEECGSLVEPKGHCPACVAPQLTLDQSALPQARVGDRLALTFLFANRSPAGRTLRCEAIEAFVNETAAPVTLAWAEVEAGGSRRFTLSTPVLEHGGQYSLRLLLHLASRHKGREENYMFESIGQLGVAPSKDASTPQITISGNVSGGGLINIAGLMSAAGAAEAERAAVSPPSLLQRADAREARDGLRGYGPRAGYAPRDVEFVFSGFAAADRPPDRVIFGPRGFLSCGRAGRKFHKTDNPEPNDLALRLYKADGEVDEAASRAISRRHFDLFVMNGRLHIEVRAGGGLALNGQRLAAGAVQALQDGDQIAPMPGKPEILSLKLRLIGRPDDIRTVEIARLGAGGQGER